MNTKLRSEMCSFFEIIDKMNNFNDSIICLKALALYFVNKYVSIHYTG